MRRLVLSLLLAPLLCLVGLASPASAAPTITSFTVNGESGTVTVPANEDVTVAWDVTGTDPVTVTATGDGWNGTLETSGTRTVQGPGPGESITFGLDTSDSTGAASATTITVTGEAAAEGATPPPVVVERCSVTVPRSDSFDYRIVFDGDEQNSQPIPAGTVKSAFITSNGLVPAEIVAVPRADVTVAPGATTRWTVRYDDGCASTLVKITAAPCSFTVENVAAGQVEFLYGDPDAPRADGQFALAPGEKRTVRTPREQLLAAAVLLGEQDADFQTLDVRVPQTGCDGGAVADGGAGRDWPFPTKAPAAGVTGTERGGAPLWLPVGLLLVVGVAAGAARARATR